MRSFRLHPLAARWLRADAAAADGEDAPDWDGWVLQRMSRSELAVVGDVFVDRAVLSQRFACVSDRCAPSAGRGSVRSCCADAFVPLSSVEDRRLARRGLALLDWLKDREPRLAQHRGREFFRDPGAVGLARPGGRCVFSQLDEQGRIRCHLHAYAKHAHIERAELQPLSCRLFPLIVVDRGRGRALLTVVARHTRRLVSAHPADRYPCLGDVGLPPLYEAMRGDLDWLFGNGFANALRRVATQEVAQKLP